MVKYAKNAPQKSTLKIQKSKIGVLVLNQSLISAVFAIVRIAGDPKTALTGDPLYYILHRVQFYQNYGVDFVKKMMHTYFYMYREIWKPLKSKLENEG